MKKFTERAEHYGYQDTPEARDDYARYVAELRVLRGTAPLDEDDAVDIRGRTRGAKHSPRNCVNATEEECLLPLRSGSFYAPLATLEKLQEIGGWESGGEGDFHQALLAWDKLPEEEKERYPWSREPMRWEGVPETEWFHLSYCYRDVYR